MNNNQALIDGLRKAADFLEAKPDFPSFEAAFSAPSFIRLWCWNNKEKLQEAARHLGTFEKRFDDHYFTLVRAMNEAVQIEVCIDRSAVCKKIVTWDCPDDESLLKLVSTETVEAE